jgi:hypothetical protein
VFADGSEIPPAPDTPTGPLPVDVIDDLDTVFASLAIEVDFDAVARIGESGDARLAWIISDLLRFFQRGALADVVIEAFNRLTTRLGTLLQR